MLLDILFKPHIELFNQDTVLLPCDLRVKLGRNSEDFYLMVKDISKKYKVIISDSTLFLRTLKFKERYEDQLVKGVKNTGAALYPMLCTNATSFSIGSGTKSYTYPVGKLGKQVVQIYLAFISSDAFNGDFSKNPFNFLPLSLTDASFSLNGKQFPSTPLKMTWDQDSVGMFLRAYNELQKTTGLLQCNGGWGVDCLAYPQGFFILGEKLSEKFTDISFAPEQQGTLSISLRFNDALTENITRILIMEYQNTMKMSPSGKISLDYDVTKIFKKILFEIFYYNRMSLNINLNQI